MQPAFGDILSDTKMWLESHGNLARHPKTRRLMQRMGWTLPHTIGNLHLLWWWALEYAPTGDLTSFEPGQLTYDLDLGGATPEQFLEAMIHAGFIDRIGSGPAESRSGGTMVEAGFLDKDENNTLRIHDWPEYTARSLRPKFRKTPDRWHQVLRSYGLSVITRRKPAPTNFTRNNAPAPEPSTSTRAERDSEIVEHGPQGAVRVDCVEDTAHEQKVGMALRAVRRVSTHGTDENTEATFDFEVAPSQDEPLSVNVEPAQQPSTASATIPQCLSARRNFNDWWRKLQEQYENKGCPLTAHEQTELLAMLARNPFAAVEKLQYSVVNFEKSYATLLAPQEKQSENTS